jgi:hypothetical protein
MSIPEDKRWIEHKPLRRVLLDGEGSLREKICTVENTISQRTALVAWERGIG